jgi:hypothetical protein
MKPELRIGLELEPVRTRATRCGWCKRFRADNGHWFSVSAGGLLDYIESWVIEHGKCEDCARAEEEGLI